MLGRITFLFILGFWLTMNYLLWRAEFAPTPSAGSRVAPEVIWRRVLTAPDDSALAVVRRGERVGFCRWAVNVGEELATGVAMDEETVPEGMVQGPAQYTIDFDGNASLDEFTQRLRFGFFARFTTNHVWREFKLRLGHRPLNVDLVADADRQTVHVDFADGNTRWGQDWRFEELRDPRRLLEGLGVPALTGMSALLPLGRGAGPSLGLDWDARQDWFRIGRSRVRAYRLRARLVDRYEVVIFVSRVGEILRVELPGDLVLINDALLGFGTNRTGND